MSTATEGSSGSSPRILFYEGNPDGTVGGSYFSLYFLVDGIDRRRYTPIVGFRRDIPFVDRFRALGVDVHIVPGHVAISTRLLQSPLVRRLPPLRLPLRGLLAGLNLLRFAAVSGPRWRAFLRKQRISLVHANNSVTRCHDLMLGAMLAGIPVITHERGINDRFSRRDRFFASRLSAVICISHAVKDILTTHGVTSTRMPVIYNALDPSRVRPGRAAKEVRMSHGVGEAQPVLVMVGNIRRWKGQDVVVKALARVRQALPDVVCFFVGDAAEVDKPFERELLGLVEQSGLARNVRFVGYQENVADYIAAADVAVHASTSPEPFGRVLVESMALGRPVVGARAGAVPEIVLNGVTGHTFEPGNADDLAACVVDLLRDPQKAAQMGRAGHERLLREFSVRENVEKTQYVYDDLLHRESRETKLA